MQVASKRFTYMYLVLLVDFIGLPLRWSILVSMGDLFVQVSVLGATFFSLLVLVFFGHPCTECLCVVTNLSLYSSHPVQCISNWLFTSTLCFGGNWWLFMSSCWSNQVSYMYAFFAVFWNDLKPIWLPFSMYNLEYFYRTGCSTSQRLVCTLCILPLQLDKLRVSFSNISVRPN